MFAWNQRYPDPWVGMLLCVKACSVKQWDVREISYSKAWIAVCVGRCMCLSGHAQTRNASQFTISEERAFTC